MNKIQRIPSALTLVIFLVVGLSLSGRAPSASAGANLVQIPLNGARITESSPATADFNGDGFKEIIVGGSDGILHVASFNGATWSEVWSRQTNLDISAANPPTPTADNDIRSSPAIADLDNDGHLDIVIAVGGDVHDPDLGKHHNGGVLVYRYDGSAPWSFSLIEPLSANGTRGWPQPRIDQVGWPPPGYGDQDGFWDGIVTTPALGDLDGDGDLEVVVLGIDRRIHAWHHTGEVVAGWPIYRYNGDNLLRGGLSSPALGDIDGDGLPEVIVGTMSPPWDGRHAPDYSKGTLWAINGDSTNVPGFPITTEQYIHSSPALGDIDNDKQLEIVVGVGWGSSGRENLVYAWNHDGTPLPNWPRETAGATSAPPALGDIDGDGLPEVVIGCGSHYDPGCGYLYAWNADGSSVSGFPTQPAWPDGSPEVQIDLPYTPILADYDSDGTTEILVVHRASWGFSLVEPNGVTSDRSHSMWGGLITSVLVDDVDNDSKPEVVAAGADVKNLNINRGGIQIWNEHGSATAALPWPMFHYNVARTGRCASPPRLGFPGEIRLWHQAGSGDTESTYALVQNEGEGQFDWSITHAIAGLQVTPSTGTAASTTPVQFIVTTTGLSTGWNTLGTVTVTGTVGGDAIDGSPITAVVYVYVGDVSRVYLPSVMRNS